LGITGADTVITAYPLTSYIGGSGTGSVSAAGLSCAGSLCKGSYAPNAVVVITPQAATGSTFSSWSGVCTGTNPTCTVTMDRGRSVTAIFTRNNYTLTVNPSGNGSGTITCPGLTTGTLPASMVYPYSTTPIAITAKPDTGSSFTGWSGGGCSGTGSCNVTIDQAKSVTASFTLNTYPLYVLKLGEGSGSVTGSGISCSGALCSGTYSYNTQVTLAATAETGHTFAGWSGGGCSGTGACTTTIRNLTKVSARFEPPTHDITVSLAGDGGGTVTSNPGGISCANLSCTGTAAFAYDSTVELLSTPDAISVFGGWSGACSGQSTCFTVISADKTVIATFNLAPKAMIGTTGYTSLNLAYIGAEVSGSTLLVLDAELTENLNMNSYKSITLKGGYKADYSGKSGMPTVLKGILTIGTGSLTVEGLAVK
ncbi:MAG TPA: hypothetical protein DER40_01670, partial [Geobacter sp.]|nr:hypothetical protein [Geobacter sp.]